jgi:hypothetical protein
MRWCGARTCGRWPVAGSACSHEPLPSFVDRGSGKSTEELIERGPERVSYLHYFLCVGLVGSKIVLSSLS